MNAQAHTKQLREVCDNWRKHLAYNLMAVLEWEIIELLQPQPCVREREHVKSRSRKAVIYVDH